MSLLLLVEGEQTEPSVYKAWIHQHLPSLRAAANVAGLVGEGYVLVRGKGYPSANRRIAGLLRDIDENPGKVDEFWICVDSDEDSYDERYRQVQRAVDEAASATTIQKTSPLLKIRIIIQHCCIETWFLGHDGFMRAGPQSRKLVEFKRFYDVSLSDPELMGRPPGYVTRASFHLDYLREMLAERNHRYSKRHPGVVADASYFQALKSRCERTAHLRSFQRLVDAFGECSNKPNQS